jgi:hypothetical protein
LCTLATVVSVAVSSGHDVFRYDGSASNAAPVRTTSAATTRTTVPRAVTLAAEREIADAPRSWSSLITGDRATKAAPRAGASALEDASQAANKAAEGPINISKKHLAGAGGRYNKLAEGVEVDSVVREALRSPNGMFRPNPGGGYRIDTDLGRVIGQGGRRTVRTIVSEDGRVITAFPYGPKGP